MFTTISRHESHVTGTPSYQAAYESLLEELKVLGPEQWPADKSVGFWRNRDWNFGQKVSIKYWEYKNIFRDLVENHTIIQKVLIPLFNCTKLIPCSTADCERGFSLMNVTITPTRSRLTSLMFVKLHGPSLRDLDPEPYVKTWLRKHRIAEDNRTRQSKPVESEKPDPFGKFL